MASGFSYSEAMNLTPADLLMWTIARSSADRGREYDSEFDYDRLTWREPQKKPNA